MSTYFTYFLIPFTNFIGFWRTLRAQSSRNLDDKLVRNLIEEIANAILVKE